MQSSVSKYALSVFCVMAACLIGTAVTAEDTNEQEQYRLRIQQDIDKLQAKIDKLRTKAAAAEDPSFLDKWADDLQAMQADAQARLDKIAAAGAEGWQSMQAGIEDTLQKA